MTQDKRTKTFVPWENTYPPVHPCTSQEEIMQRIAVAIESLAAHQAGTNERLDSLREGLACTNVILEEATTR